MESTNDDDHHQQQSSFDRQQKQGAANFFDYEDEEDNLTINSSTSLDKKIPEDSSSTTLSKTVNKSINVEDKFEKDGKFCVEFIDDNIDQRMARLIESNLNSSTTKCSNTFNNVQKLSTRQAVDKIIAGDHDHVNLCGFKGREQKLELLDYAILSGDKYTITLVIQFLEHTLKRSIMFYELIRRPIAADHYLIYLHSDGRLDEQLNIMNMMGRYEDAAFASYSRAVSPSTMNKTDAQQQQQIRLLERALSNFTTGGNELIQYHSLIQEHITLLKHQLPIESDDRRRCEMILHSNSNVENVDSNIEDNQSFVIHQPRPCLIGLSLMKTLYYCHLYHHHLPDNNFASPFHLKKQFHISERQFLWIALQSLAKTMRWQEIDTLFEYKSWLGSRKIRRNIIPIVDIVEILQKNSAPKEMLEKYLDLVDDIEKRLQLAKEFQMNKYAADILIKLRDRKRLNELRTSILGKMNEMDVQRYIDNALIATTIKWRN
ncbi:spermatogenesis-defective protein 39 [Dermatophagoides pteronyssinus]|uniref:Spermatogenesis-defective protein 39 n=1 Tax=Dermatophagoides pteronyssinus TaxID=6956 RepID=A0ABQ8IX70_DERPT|nr:spermatogenesis-defective protein 39 [Dermatophagoides pteronyssinus]